jgi:hypothetical protein
MKSLKLYLIVLLLSFLPFILIFFTQELPHTSDGGVQIPRMAAFFNAVSDGHIPVRWAGELNYGYGLPLFNFIYHTPFYISTMLIATGVGLIPSFKIVLLLSYVLSGIGMLAFSLAFFKDKRTAFLVTMLYQFAPYRFVEILTRGSVGGIYAYAFLPFILLGIVLLWKKPSFPMIAFIAVFGALMIISHNALALLFFGCIALFILFFSPSLKKIFYAGCALVATLSLSAFYWLPALLEHKYTYGDLFMKNLYTTHFPPFLHLIIPNLTDETSLRVAEINIHIGIIHTFAVLASLYFLWKYKSFIPRTLSSILTPIRDKKETREQSTVKIALYGLIIVGVSLLFMNSASTPIWERLSFLRQFQFPWRFLGIVVFATSLLGSVLMRWNIVRTRIGYILLILLIILPTLYYWRPTQGYTYGATDEQFWNYPLNTTYFGETDVIWSAGPAQSYPSSLIQIVSGDAQINNVYKTTQQHSFRVLSEQGATLVSNTQFFPGWKVYVDNVENPHSIPGSKLERTHYISCFSW